MQYKGLPSEDEIQIVNENRELVAQSRNRGDSYIIFSPYIPYLFSKTST